MMHTIKGGWIGQTFALAKCNETEVKKSRIRRSKEERKTMVKSFIKKYQSSNNGNFPSMNLTHKEVGGSFYTVREIVREIIQENRVLGPANLIAEELNPNQFDEEYPLGTISTELQIPPDMSSNGSPFVSSQQKGTNEEQQLVTVSTELLTPPDMTSNCSPFVPSHLKGNNEDQISISDGLSHEHENQMFDNVQIINGIQADLKTEESNESTSEALPTSKSFESEKKIERLAASPARVTPITADVVVETFPQRPVPKTAETSSATYGVKNSTETLEKNEIEKVNWEAGNDSVPLDQLHYSKNSGSVSGQNGTILTGVTMDKTTDPQLKRLVFSTMEGGTVPDAVVGRNVDVEVSHNDVLTYEINDENQGIARTKEINNQNVKILGGSNSRQESKTPKANMIVNEAGVPSKETSQKGSNPTVERIQLESWERASRNCPEMETNPLVAIFKSFVIAFMKFWSE